MKKRLSLLVCLLLAASASMAQTQSNTIIVYPTQAPLDTWQMYTIKGEEVSATFPTHPAMTTYQHYQGPLQKKPIDRLVAAYADGVVYMAYTFEKRKGLASVKDLIEQQIETEGWEVSAERIVKLGDLTGKEYSWTKRNLLVTAQFFAAKDRFYRFAVGGVPASDERVQKFFSSIVIGKKQGTEVSDGIGLPFPHTTGGEIFTGKQVDSKVVLVMKPEPRYTELARREQTMGQVVLKAVLSSSGSVVNIQTVSALPNGLTEEAIEAAQKIKFIPAMKNGKYVSNSVQLEYNFNLY
jgi:TonB family protein